MAKVVHKSICNCGAITLVFDNGAVNSMRKRTYERLPKRYHICDNEPLHTTWACDHCANHFGIDISEKKGSRQILEEVQETFFYHLGNKIPLSKNCYLPNDIENFKNGTFNKKMDL